MARIRLLIMTGFETLEGFLLPMEHRCLVWSLDQANVEWYLYNPWRPLPDPSSFDALYVSVYRFYNRNFVFHGRRREAEVAAAGLPVVNTVEHAHGLHSHYLRVWAEAGIRCARFQHFSRFEDLSLDCYPLILRRDGMHRGSGMFLVRTPEEAEACIARRAAQVRDRYPDARGVLPLNLAIEFIETERFDGYYHKFRSYVVGDRVIPAHFMRSRSPLVNYKDAALWAQACSMDETFRLEGEPHPERVIEAARATGLEIITLDYSRLRDGSYVFWEGNRVRATAGDAHVAWLEMRETELEYGQAVVDRILDRVGTRPRPMPRAASRPGPEAFLR